MLRNMDNYITGQQKNMYRETMKKEKINLSINLLSNCWPRMLGFYNGPFAG